MQPISLETRTADGLTHYLEIVPGHDVVRWGSHAGSGHTDNCMTMTLQKFSAGLSAYEQKTIEKLFGKSTICNAQQAVAQFLQK